MAGQLAVEHLHRHRQQANFETAFDEVDAVVVVDDVLLGVDLVGGGQYRPGEVTVAQLVAAS